ncbi:3D domain-containing protein [Maridesulfovibrio sp.]|uniref:3D domain-containing protein n=1 Tax=unclassified Maridesulfovibrio TaxID=2794999 RepID=UPI003B00DB10
MTKFRNLILILAAIFMLSSCLGENNTVTMKVASTAYTSHVAQTSAHPFLGAWGDELKPGMKCIAVSRDLIPKGLTHNTKVKIEGLSGEYIVKDKMNKRWTDKIDIYMGLDTKAAKEWGKREVTITFEKQEKK